uniref:Uncharacterized protein n=1 Tax=Setaria viridis TaxID=4556 RepID=A0A4V6Y8Q2_SETVI|nr:hypothetical protein SEVIR_3G295732v2 [Setaria viridis]
MAANDQQPLHILFFPQVAAGHLIPVADMANLFSSRGVKCTILTTPKNAAVIRLAVDQAANGASGGTGFPAIDISTVPFPDVGLPPSFESIADLTSQADKGKLVDALHRLCEPLDRFLAEHRPDAVVVDSFLVIPPPSTTSRGWLSTAPACSPGPPTTPCCATTHWSSLRMTPTPACPCQGCLTVSR